MTTYKELNIFPDPQLNKLVHKCLDKNMKSVAELFYHIYSKEFVYSNNKWYSFDKYRWRSDNDHLLLSDVGDIVAEFPCNDIWNCKFKFAD